VSSTQGNLALRALNDLKGDRVWSLRPASHDAAPLTPPWFLPGLEIVWQRIVETERALRATVREAHATRFGDSAAAKIEDALDGRQRETLSGALCSRPAACSRVSCGLS
jgi:hypothetical protein